MHEEKVNLKSTRFKKTVVRIALSIVLISFEMIKNEYKLIVAAKRYCSNKTGVIDSKQRI